MTQQPEGQTGSVQSQTGSTISDSDTGQSYDWDNLRDRPW
jgi:hypothetical protein